MDFLVKGVFCFGVKDATTVNSTSNKKKKDEYEGSTKPAKVLKEGSVLDILKSPGKTTESQNHRSWKGPPEIH